MALPADPGPPAPLLRLPAAARVALYLAAWFWVAGMLMAPLLLAASTGALPAELLDPSGGAPGALARALAVQTAILLPATLLVTWLFGMLEGRPLRAYGLVPHRGAALHWLAGVAVDGAHLGLVFGVGLLCGAWRVTGAADPLTALGVVATAAAIAVPAAAVEEILIRGYVQGTLAERYRPAVAVGAGAAIFSAMHALNPGGAHPGALLGLLAAGVYFGVAYRATGSLWLPIAGHATWNVLLGPVFGLPVSGLVMAPTVLTSTVTGPAWLTGGTFGPEAGFLALATTLLFTPVVWVVGRRLPGSRRPGER